VVVREYHDAEGEFSLALACAGDECRTGCGDGGSCPGGSTCTAVCDPCLAFCEPIDPTVADDTDDPCDATSTACGPCRPEECGPEPALPGRLCEDGVTVAGPAGCVRNDDGTCGWLIIECPEDR
jgi:hypothetical protein